MVSKVDRTVCPSLQTFYEADMCFFGFLLETSNRSSALGEKFGQQITERIFRVRVMLPL